MSKKKAIKVSNKVIETTKDRRDGKIEFSSIYWK
jgi:hypothetical protein